MEEEWIWASVYLISICINLFVSEAMKLSENSAYKNFRGFEILIPGINTLSAGLLLAMVIFDGKTRRYIIPTLFNLDVATIDEESRTELDESRRQMRNAIEAARRHHADTKTIVKRKATKKKLCSKLGLTLDDLERIKEIQYDEKKQVGFDGSIG